VEGPILNHVWKCSIMRSPVVRGTISRGSQMVGVLLGILLALPPGDWVDGLGGGGGFELGGATET
jgi:hypothetical protein